MVDIDKYLKNLDFLINNIEKESDSIILKNKEKILDLNRENQLFDLGIDGNGRRIFPLYRPYTIFSKRMSQLPYNRVTLFDTGAFYNAFDLRNQNGNILIFSRDSKSSELQDKYGSSIFGLTNENQRILNSNIIRPELLTFINRYI